MSISLKNLSPARIGDKNKFKFKDIKLDLSLGNSGNNPSMFSDVLKRDINSIYDESAIKQSIKCLFLTRKGEKAIDPNYGMNLDEFLFMNITDDYASIIGRKMLEAINTYEPRVVIDQLNVIPDTDNNEYAIIIVMRYIELNNQFSLIGSYKDNIFTDINN